LTSFDDKHRLVDITPNVVNQALKDIDIFDRLIERIGQIVTPSDNMRLLLSILTSPVRTSAPWARPGIRLECYEDSLEERTEIAPSNVHGPIKPVFISFRTLDGTPFKGIRPLRANLSFHRLSAEMRNTDHENAGASSQHYRLRREDVPKKEQNPDHRYHVRFFMFVSRPSDRPPAPSATAPTVAIETSTTPQLRLAHPSVPGGAVAAVPRPGPKGPERFIDSVRKPPSSKDPVPSKRVAVVGGAAVHPKPEEPISTLDAVKRMYLIDPGTPAEITPLGRPPGGYGDPHLSQEKVFPLTRKKAATDSSSREDEHKSSPHSSL
jgi:hypothetical protein